MDDIYKDADKPKDIYLDGRFDQPPNPGEAYKSRYDMDSAAINDIQQRGILPFSRYDLDLGAAPPLYFKEMILSGRGFVFFMANAGVPGGTAKVTARVNVNDGACAWDCYHGRGFRGDIGKLFLDWTIQAGMTAVLYVFHFDGVPFTGSSV